MRLRVSLILCLALALLVMGTAQAQVVTKCDKLVIGNTVFSTCIVNLAPSTAATGGIYFGSDVTLYRSAANTLKTDDSLTVTGTLGVTGGTTLTGALDANGAVTLGDAAADVITVNGTATFAEDTAFSSTVALNGDVTGGDATTDTLTMTGRLVIRFCTDAGPMTNTAGTKGELVFCTNNDKVYVCTVTGDPATWAALN